MGFSPCCFCRLSPNGPHGLKPILPADPGIGSFSLRFDLGRELAFEFRMCLDHAENIG